MFSQAFTHPYIQIVITRLFSQNSIEEVTSHPYYHQVWHYQEVDTELIRQTIVLFDWKKASENTSVDEKVAAIKKAILNVIHNFIPHETLLVDGKDKKR